MARHLILAGVLVLTLCHLSEGETLVAACDNEMQVYADGNVIGEATNWQLALTLSIADDTEVLAVACKNAEGPCGFIVSSDGDAVTDSSWKCSGTEQAGWTAAGYDDSNWDTAKEYGAYGVAPWTTNVDPDPTNGKWIGSTSGCATGAVSYCRKELSGKRLVTACDNEMTVYADGNKIGEATNWREALTLYVADDTEVLAVTCKNTGGPCGFIMSSDDDFQTDSSWKCSGTEQAGWTAAGYDDSNWDSAVEYGAYGVAPWTDTVEPDPTNGKWIGSTSGCATGAVSYCRKELSVEIPY